MNNLREQFEAMIDAPTSVVGIRNRILDLMQKAYDMQRWVECSERLPDSDGQFNVCYKMPNGEWHIFTSGYSILYKCFDFGSKNITHWQPLPAPPTTQDERK